MSFWNGGRKQHKVKENALLSFFTHERKKMANITLKNIDGKRAGLSEDSTKIPYQ